MAAHRTGNLDAFCRIALALNSKAYERPPTIAGPGKLTKQQHAARMLGLDVEWYIIEQVRIRLSSGASRVQPLKGATSLVIAGLVCRVDHTTCSIGDNTIRA